MTYLIPAIHSIWLNSLSKFITVSLFIHQISYVCIISTVKLVPTMLIYSKVNTLLLDKNMSLKPLCVNKKPSNLLAS